MTKKDRQIRKAAIVKWLIENGIKQAQVAKAVGRDESLVCLWVSGDRRSPVVAEYLRKKGMPEHLIYKGMKKAA
ncbi:MAG: hypothetical protein SWH61_05495 [Thermodesulfobacteriota bacterium]|nr:hypothetical protein [Thermodesulfobacteriota bacterium]